MVVVVVVVIILVSRTSLMAFLGDLHYLLPSPGNSYIIWNLYR